MLKTALALGSFDGLHAGHLQVLENTKALAHELALEPSVLLFDEHPAKALTGEAPKALLLEQDRRIILGNMGIKTETVSFREIMNLSCEDFIKKILIEKLQVGAVCCGFNYRFGFQGQGDVNTLRQLCGEQGIRVQVTDSVLFEGTPVSSTRIRQALLEGDAVLGAKLLRRPFLYTLPVIHGEKRGRTLGFPTANQSFPEGFLVPGYGVYASQTEAQGGVYPSVTNIGIRPTVGGNLLLSETNIMGYQGDLYGKPVRVGLIKLLRGEKSFGSFRELSNQIEKDSRDSLEVWKATGGLK